MSDISNKNIHKTSICDKFVLLLICLASMSFLSKPYYIIAIAFIAFVIASGKIYFDGTTIILLSLSLVFAMCNLTAGEPLAVVLKHFAYPICYMLGFGFIKKEQQNDRIIEIEPLINRVLIVIALGVFIHCMLNFTINFGDATSRNTVDFWTGETKSATVQASILCIPIAFFLAQFFSKISRTKKFLVVIFTTMLFAYNLMLAGRTLFVIAIIALCYNLFFLIKYENAKIRKIFLVACSAVFVLFFVFTFNVFGIKGFVFGSEFYSRFFENDFNSLGEDGRFILKKYYLQHFFDYPMGGCNLRNSVGYAHDIFLDTYDEYGIFALLFVVLFVGCALSNCFKLLRNDKVSFSLRRVISVLYIVVFVSFCIEPIFQGVPWLFASFCIINGMTSAINHNYSEGKKHESFANQYSL